MPRQRNCFVIMPFTESASGHDEQYWTNFFTEVIRDPVEECGYHCYRSETAPCNITKKIVCNLLEDDLVIAVLTDYNPNVWYELATRHAFNKNTIMLIDKNQRIPFDISVYGAIQYEDTLKGHKKLIRDLQYFIKNKLEDNTSHSDTIDDDLKALSHADNPIAEALLLNQSINSLPQTYKVIPRGFRNITFPHDLKLTSEPCKILVIGIRNTFIPPKLLTIIDEEKHPVQILINRDQTVSEVRAKALNRRFIENYFTGNEKYLEDFKGKYETKKNVKIKTYTRYPFGLYMNVGNYSWFAPLWNSDDKGSAIHQLVIEVRRKSQIGWKLHEEFSELWAGSEEL